MSLTIITPPAEEPVSLDTVKAHLRVDGIAEDTVITRMLAAARAHIEDLAALAIMPQVLEWRFDAWPETGVLDVPKGPVSSVSELAVAADDGSWHALPVEDYVLDPGIRARVTVTGEAPSPALAAGGVRMTFSAGFAAAVSVPEPLVEAICLLTAHFYERREPFEAGRVYPVPKTVAALIESYRWVRI